VLNGSFNVMANLAMPPDWPLSIGTFSYTSFTCTILRMIFSSTSLVTIFLKVARPASTNYVPKTGSTYRFSWIVRLIQIQLKMK
jgi:hypothetical protein